MHKRKHIFGSPSSTLQFDPHIPGADNTFNVIRVVPDLEKRLLVKRERPLKQVKDMHSQRPNISLYIVSTSIEFWGSS